MNTAPGYGSGVGGQQHHHLQQQPATAGAPGTSIPPSTSRPGYLGPWPGTAWTSTGRVLGHTSSATAGPGSTGIQHSPVSPNLHAPMAAGGALGVPAWKRTPPGGVPDLLPVLCLNTWEHVWLHDYGIRGKREYVENWWKVIDWEVVAGVAGIGGEVSGGRW